jgi:hypothetical protein
MAARGRNLRRRAAKEVESLMDAKHATCDECGEVVPPGFIALCPSCRVDEWLARDEDEQAEVLFDFARLVLSQPTEELHARLVDCVYGLSEIEAA